MGSQEGGSASNGMTRTRIQTQYPIPNPLTRPGSFCGLTLDEVQNHLGDLGKPLSSMNLDRRANLGETTLEDFLVKTGVVSESGKTPSPARGVVVVDGEVVGLSEKAHWMNYDQMPSSVFALGHHQIPGRVNTVMDFADYFGSPLGTLNSSRKRVGPDDTEENRVKRRQKRMIKNRQSADRSRARKQAYTYELESEVSRLKEENKQLKRQKELEKMLHRIPPSEPKNRLRRMNSAPM